MRELQARIAYELKEMGESVNLIKEDSLELHSTNNSEQQRRLTGIIALNLHGFYTGAERIFEAIARDVDRNVSAGPEWHKTLLAQMTTEIPGVRSPVISQSTFSCMNSLRGFRHVVRSHYGHKLKTEPVLKLADEVFSCYEALEQDLQSFCQSLKP